MNRPVCPPGVAAHWIEADLLADPRHPLERELASRQDAAARYTLQRIVAEEAGHQHQADQLGRLLQDQLAELGRIQAALHRLRRPWPYRPPARQPVVLFLPVPLRHPYAVGIAAPLGSARPGSLEETSVV